jgi:hypothetical protein
VRAGEYASAHTAVFHPFRTNYRYHAHHPHLVLLLDEIIEFDVLTSPDLFGPHRKAVVIVSRRSDSVFMLLHMVAALDHVRVPVLFVFSVGPPPLSDFARFECEAHREAAANLGLRLECRDVSALVYGHGAWWDEADALVAMALAPADRRVRARIGE